MYDILSRFIPADRVSTEEPMANHTSFKVGGPAEVYVQPASVDELRRVIEECRRCGVSFAVLGHGSNVLVPDGGLRGVVIQLTGCFGRCWVDDSNKGCLSAEAGASLSSLAHLAMQEGLSGLEFASGIPGSVGGAVFMNAGAYGQDISDVCTEVTVLMPDGEIAAFSRDEMGFGYRKSSVQENGGIILSAKFATEPSDKDAVSERMRELNLRRRESQPLEFPSAGSTFKRPQGHYAGKLIEDCGLKGFAVGGAQVSEKHAGFIINTGGATAYDICTLVAHIQSVVKERYGVNLEPEVKILCSS